MRERERGGEKKIFFASLDNLDRLMILVIIFSFFFFEKNLKKFWNIGFECICIYVCVHVYIDMDGVHLQRLLRKQLVRHRGQYS